MNQERGNAADDYTPAAGGQGHYRLLFEAMAQGVLFLDGVGRITDANVAAERILGIGVGEMVGRAPGELGWRPIRGDGRELTEEEQPFSLALSSGQRVRDVLMGVYNPREGHYRWVQVDVVPHVQPSNRLAWQLIATLTDVTARREAEERLRDGEAQFRLLAENATDMITRHTRDGWFVYVSPSCRSLLGYEPEELIGRDPWDFVHPEDQGTVRQAHMAVLARSLFSTVCYRFRRKDGSYQWFETTSKVAIDDSGGGVEEIHAVSRDISHRKRAEEALRASEERLRTLVSNLPVVLFAVDADGVFTVSEGRGLSALGLKPGQVVGRSVFEVYRDHPEVLESVRRGLRGEMENTVATVGGRVLHTRYAPLRRADGSLEGVIGVAVDITEQRRAEQQLRNLSSAVEQSPASVVITDPQGVIEYVNPKFEQVTGYSASEVVGQKASLLKSGAMSPEFYRGLWQTLTSGQEWRGEFHNRKKNGELFWESAVLRPIKDEAGRVTHYLAVKEDVTERKRAEEVRARLEVQLRESQKLEAFGQLAGGVAHDFNNILTVIQSHACMLQNDMLTEPERQESVREIARSAERAANLTAQLLAFSRRQVLQPQDVDLNEVLAQMTRMLQRLIGEHIALEARYAPGGALVHADTGMLEQVLLNLAVNARDAMPRGGRLTLATEWVALSVEEARRLRGGRAGDFIRLTVSDTGCGIAPEVLPRVFEPFFTTKEVGKGTGLGLSTVLGIVEQHSGWVDVESGVGQGTVFSVYLPRLERPGAVPVHPPGVEAGRRGTETLLVVEDEPPLRLLVRTILERQGYHVLEASSGVEAIRVWEQHRPHVQLMITDLVMPEGVTGLELAQRIQAQDPAIRVVFTTGYGQEMLDTGFLKRGAKFLPKPYDPAKLTRVVRDCLDGK